MKIESIDINVNKVVNIAIDAGKEILRIYQQDSFDQQLKLDKSPLTEADIASHNLITNQLQKITPNVPILSEESKKTPWNVRKSWNMYWLIDPLDGTKEFIKKNGEFTVNIALIHQNDPIIGVVHAPVLNQTWVGEHGKSAIKIEQGSMTTIKTAPYKSTEICQVVGSRSHAGDSLNKFLQKLGEYQLMPIGSSIKLCLVAEGKAHIYPRLGLTSEWDTAAAHAVVNSAGGEVFEFETKTPLKYNTKDSLLNPYFVVQDKSSMFL
jgi:3'(2'), 5'-bisphosphate nucleotidase